MCRIFRCNESAQRYTQQIDSDTPPLTLVTQATPGPFNIPVFQPVRPLPSVQFKVERVNVEHSVPMYAPEVVSTVSSLSQPSENLLHHCYAHIYLKVNATVFYTNPSCPLSNRTQGKQHSGTVHCIVQIRRS